jgi:hypothetical protein
MRVASIWLFVVVVKQGVKVSSKPLLLSHTALQ